MPVRFLLDEHLDTSAARELRRLGVDTLTVVDARRQGMEDIDHLAWAFAEGRTIVTCDRDFLVLTAKRSDHAGVVFFSWRPDAGAIVRELMKLHADGRELLRAIVFR